MSHPYGGEYHEDKQMEGLKVKHTAGSWQVVKDSISGYGHRVLDEKGNRIATTALLGSEEKLEGRDEEREANAALIAAAPEMYAFMKRCQTDPDFEGHTAEAELHRILAKAEGRS